MSDCVVYCKNVSFRGFQEARNHSRPSEISSLSEAKARKLIRDAGEVEGAVACGEWARVEGKCLLGVGREPSDIGLPSGLEKEGHNWGAWSWLGFVGLESEAGDLGYLEGRGGKIGGWKDG